MYQLRLFMSMLVLAVIASCSAFAATARVRPQPHVAPQNLHQFAQQTRTATDLAALKRQHALTNNRAHRATLDQGGDDCSTATGIFGLPSYNYGTTSGYSDDYAPSCTATVGEPDVVYSYTPASDETVNIRLFSNDFATLLYVYENDCSGAQYACAGTPCPVSTTPPYSFTSHLSNLFLSGGNTYYFVVDGYADSGTYELDVIPYPGPGDTGEDAYVIGALPFSYSGNTYVFLDDYNEVCDPMWPEPGSPDMVFAYTPAANESVYVSVCGANYDSRMMVYDGCNNLVGCNEDYCLMADNVTPWASAIPGIGLLASHTYYIVVDGWAGNNGNFTLLMDQVSTTPCNPLTTFCGSPTETEPNNDCFQPDPIPLVTGTTVYGNICTPGDVDDYYWPFNGDSTYIVWLNSGENCDQWNGPIGFAYCFCPNGGCTIPVQGGWLNNCGPGWAHLAVQGMTPFSTGPYTLWVETTPNTPPECVSVCTDAAPLVCGVPDTINTCNGCQVYCGVPENGCGYYAWASGPQKFYSLTVTEAANYCVDVVALNPGAGHQDVQFSIFTDCTMPRTSCVYSQDRNAQYWGEPTGPDYSEVGCTFLEAGTYYLGVSFGQRDVAPYCGDMVVKVSCGNMPCDTVRDLTVHYDHNTDMISLDWTAPETGMYYVYTTTNTNPSSPAPGPDWWIESVVTSAMGHASWATPINPDNPLQHFEVIAHCYETGGGPVTARTPSSSPSSLRIRK